MRLLWHFLQRFLRHRWREFGGLACIPLAALLNIEITLRISKALDQLKDADDTSFLKALFWIVLGLALVRGLFRFLQRWWVVCVSRVVENELKQDLFDKLVSLDFKFHDQSRSGDIASRLTSDVENLRMFLGPGIMYLAEALVMVPVSLFALSRLDGALTAWMVLPLLLMGLGMKLLTPTLHKHSTHVQESLADLSHLAQENFGGVRVVKGYGLEGSQSARFERASAKNREHQVDFARARGVTHALTYGAHDLTFLPILLVGGLALIDRTLSVGNLFVFIDLTVKVFWPVIALGWMAGMYPRALASAERVQALLDEKPAIGEVEQPHAPLEVRGEFRLRGVGYRHPAAAEDSLSGIDLDIPAGSMLGVVGPTGSGKSTLLHLFGRLLEPQGELCLDGVPVQRWSLGSLRGSLGYVPQDSFLFSERYRENIEFGTDQPLSPARLTELIRLACMQEEVQRFPDGVEQMLGERGVTLSGGQRQRTCIARALARDPKVLLLDDCLSAVDTDTESQLLANLHSESRGRTLIVAAHRLSSVMHADRIAVLQRGRLEAVGTHAELLEGCAWYRDAWQRQQALEELSAL